MPRLNNVKTEMLTAEERARFIEAARNAGQFMLMAYYTGMRRGELFRLKWTHIDFERGFITIKGEEQEGAKSSRDERIPLTQPVRELPGRNRQQRQRLCFSRQGRREPHD